MTNLFIMKDGKAQYSPVILLIPEFQKLFRRTKDADLFTKYVAYIFWMADYKSDYNSYGLNKEKQIIFDVFEGEEWKADALIELCVERYRELQNTSSMKLLQTVRTAVNSMEKYYSEMIILPEDTAETIEKKRNKFDIKKITGSIKDLKEIITTLTELENTVKEEMVKEETIIGGGGVVGTFEDPKSADAWLKNNTDNDIRHTSTQSEEVSSQD